jgi:arabinofuranosyltransferase
MVKAVQNDLQSCKNTKVRMDKITNQVCSVKRVKPKKVFVILAVGLIVLNVVFILNRAWVSDDSYITFRVVDNFLNGYGLTWNVNERVQVFTHPLWLILMTLLRVATKEIYMTSILTGIFLTTITMVVFVISQGFRISSLLGLIWLGFSNAFIDYSTSGLENPLSHILLLLFVIQFSQNNSNTTEKGENRNLILLSLLASLGTLTRWDHILIFTPALIYLLAKRQFSIKAIGICCMGFLPLVAWMLFSTFYYGFPLPNTFYAKVGDWLPRVVFLRQGGYYVLHSLINDPITVLTIVAGISLSFFHRSPKRWMLTAGGILYLGYVMYIGGDFMGGRFFSSIFLIFVYLLVHYDFQILSSKNHAWLIGILIILNLLSSVPTWKAESADYIETWRYGIVNERMFYYPTTGLLRGGRINTAPEHPWVFEGEKLQKLAGGEMRVVEAWSIGFIGYYAGSNLHLVDRYGLANALIARIPPIESDDWRIGHFEREIPAGYLDYLETNDLDQIENEYIRLYIAKMKVLVQADSTEKGRLQHIWDFNLGLYDHFLKSAYAN